jgi:hypothetical protein
MYVLQLLLALSATYCFAVFRWTRHLPAWLRLLTRLFLLCLLCPTFVVQEDGAVFAPTIVYLSFYLGDLKLDQIEGLIFQILCVWGWYMVFRWQRLAFAVHIQGIQSGCVM